MRKISEILESNEPIKPTISTLDTISGTVSNHYTPIENIVTNVRNYFGNYGIVATPGSDKTSVELRCSRWINTNEAYKDIANINVGHKTLSSYICEQGLNEMKLILEYDRIIAVFYAPDINNETTKVLNNLPDATQYTSANANEDFEIINQYKFDGGMFVEGKDDDSEIEDETPKKIQELITSDKKVKAAQDFAELISQQIDLPNDYYWKAVKDKDGNESIALRHKSTKRRPFGKKAEIIDSVLNIYGIGQEAIWVDPYDDPENVPEDMRTLIENILAFLNAEKTSDVCVYSIKDLEEKDDDENNEANQNDNNNSSSEENGEENGGENPDESNK